MDTYFYPGTLSSTLPRRLTLRKSREVAVNKDWSMLKLVGWLATAALLAFLLWQTAVVEPLWPRTVSGSLLAVIGLLAGLRISADSATEYMKDLHRLNKVLADQNQQLQEANAILLAQVCSEAAGAPKSTCV